MSSLLPRLKSRDFKLRFRLLTYRPVARKWPKKTLPEFYLILKITCNISGAAYAALPQKVSLRILCPASFLHHLAKPKSVIFTKSLLAKSTFSHFRSLCAMSMEWRYSTALTICLLKKSDIIIIIEREEE